MGSVVNHHSEEVRTAGDLKDVLDTREAVFVQLIVALQEAKPGTAGSDLLTLLTGMSSLQADLSCSRSSRVMLLVRSWRRVPYSAMTGVGGTRRQDAELELQDLVHSLALPTSSALPGMCPELRLGRPGLEGVNEDPRETRADRK